MDVIVKTYVFDLQEKEGLEDRISASFNDSLAMGYGLGNSWLTEKTLILVFCPKAPPPAREITLPLDLPRLRR